MGNCPLVTVIIPLYNGEQYIRRSVESVLAQTYDQFELIVIDDGSTDSGKDIVLTISDPRKYSLVFPDMAEIGSRRCKVRVLFQHHQD